MFMYHFAPQMAVLATFAFLVILLVRLCLWSMHRLMDGVDHLLVAWSKLIVELKALRAQWRKRKSYGTGT